MSNRNALPTDLFYEVIWFPFPALGKLGMGSVVCNKRIGQAHLVSRVGEREGRRCAVLILAWFDFARIILTDKGR